MFIQLNLHPHLLFHKICLPNTNIALLTHLQAPSRGSDLLLC